MYIGDFLGDTYIIHFPRKQLFVQFHSVDLCTEYRVLFSVTKHIFYSIRRDVGREPPPFDGSSNEDRSADL